MRFHETDERLSVSMVKNQSRKLIFKHILQKTPVTRADISIETGLSQGTVKTIVDEIIQETLPFHDCNHS